MSVYLRVEGRPVGGGITYWSIICQDKARVQAEITRLMEGPRLASFSTPARIDFADSPHIGWYVSRGETHE